MTNVACVRCRAKFTLGKGELGARHPSVGDWTACPACGTIHIFVQQGRRLAALLPVLNDGVPPQFMLDLRQKILDGL